jgi:DNA processing protein
MPEELLYQIALTQVPGIGDILAKELLNNFHAAANIFQAPKSRLEKIPGVGEMRARAIKSFDDFSKAESEIAFIKQHQIQPVFYTDETYPIRLKQCYDSPVLLYFKGNADLNHSRIITIIGTRNHTNYGKEICEQLIAELAIYDVIIVSGMAYGIDITAHKTALKNNIPTVAVLAHGLDRIYPSSHQSVAKEMVENGGLLTDFLSNTNPDKENFPKRNRIVAGLSDATIVIETGIRGGSMITANIASSYNRDVFAIPGRVTDIKSAGCNYLINNNQASLITSSEDLVEMMGWSKKADTGQKQKKLFYEFSQEEKLINNIFSQKNPLHIDEIYWQSQLSSSTVAAAMLNLEIQGIIKSLPGKMYEWIG